MKKIIATAAVALMTTTSAYAFDASFDASEYYSGLNNPTSRIVLTGTVVEDLERDGVWQQFDSAPLAQPEISDADFPSHLYEEGNYTI